MCQQINLLCEHTKDEVDLSSIELLFRMISDGMSKEEQEVFEEELIEFMKERKKAFKKDKN